MRSVILTLDPLAPLFYGWSIGLHAAVGRPDEALREFTRSLEIEPNFALSYFHAGMAYARKGLFDDAIRALEKGKRAKGETEQADHAPARMLEGRKTTQVSALTIAWALGGQGDLDAAFRWLGTAIEERDTVMPFVHIYTEILCPEMCRDPRFTRVLARMNLLDVAAARA